MNVSSFLKKKKKIRPNSYHKVFAIFVTVLCIYPLHAIAGVSEFSHVEEKNYGFNSPPRVAKIKSYDDMVVVRIVRNDPSRANAIERCNYDTLFLRNIYPNGTAVEKDIKLEGVPLFNYCSIKMRNNFDHLQYEIIGENKILVGYYNSTDGTKFEGCITKFFMRSICTKLQKCAKILCFMIIELCTLKMRINEIINCKILFTMYFTF
jgi:hypothetical protein